MNLFIFQFYKKINIIHIIYMDLAILIDGEFRSLIRNTLEKLIGKKFKKKEKNIWLF